MDISLLSDNLIVLLSLAIAGSVTYIVTCLHKKWFSLPAVYTVIAGLAASCIIQALIQSNYPTDKLPEVWFMFLPFTLAVGLIPATWKNERQWLKWLATGTAVVAFVFGLILLNNYYRFYPTLYSVFSVEARKRDQQQAQTTVQFSTATQRSQMKANSIESGLYSQNEVTNGQVYSLDIPGTISKFHARKAWVYAPAVTAGTSKINLPVIVLTPGYPGLPENWLGSGLEATMNQFAKLHHGITPLVFMVDNAGSLTNDTECVDSPRGNVETYLSTDVPNYIKANYEVGANPNNWAIGGLSMGGMCSAMIALRHPNVYNYFIDLGGESGPEVGSKQKTIMTLFGGSESVWAAHQPVLLLQTNKYRSMGAFIAVGKGDSFVLVNASRQLYQSAKNAGLETVYEEVGGQHTFTVWQQTFKDSLPWLSNRLGATECSASCN